MAAAQRRIAQLEGYVVELEVETIKLTIEREILARRPGVRRRDELVSRFELVADHSGAYRHHGGVKRGVSARRDRAVLLLRLEGWRTGQSGPKALTGMVDLSRDHAGRTRARLLDLVPGRSGKAYAAWLHARGYAFRKRVQVATLDPFHGYKERHRRPAARRHLGP